VTAPVETSLAEPDLRDTQTVWVEMFRAARTSIDIEHFYISHQPGEALEPVLAALRGAAGRGVRVRVVVDRRFHETYPETVRELDALANIEARIVDYGPRSGVQHAKFFVVDGRVSFLGSANLDWRAMRHIHEVGLHIDDVVIAQGLARIFARDWEDAAREDPDGDRVDAPAVPASSVSRSDLTLLASPRATTPEGVGDTLAALVDAIDGARATLSVQVYEYALRGHGPDQTPWTTLDETLRRAAGRGVRVRLLVDATALRRGEAELRALAGVRHVEVRTVTIPRWSGGEIPFARLAHSKYMVVDAALAWVGTENWDPGYFQNTRNVGVMVRSEAVSARLGAIFDRVWASPYATRLTP
jgi:phosphatidylserine/phosphatidylglycerophosphate/cardiolipin synthase-like enzyme